MMHTRLLSCGRWLIAFAILFFLLKQLYSLLAELEVEAVAFRSPFWLIVSLGVLISYRTLLVAPWRTLYCYAAQTPVTFQASWTLFQLSQFGRYLPGKVGQFVWIISLSHRFGIKKTSAVLATCLQLVFQCCSGVIVGFPVWQSTETASLLQKWLESFQISPKTGQLIGTLTALIFILAAVFFYQRRIRVILQCSLTQQTLHTMFSISSTLRLIGSYLLLWGLLGIAFFLFIKSLAVVKFSQFLMVTGIYAIAWGIGFLSFVTPSGLGVREGVLSLLLTIIMPPATAMLVALLSRLWTISIELLVGGGAFWIYWWKPRGSLEAHHPKKDPSSRRFYS